MGEIPVSSSHREKTSQRHTDVSLVLSIVETKEQQWRMEEKDLGI
jgi:hypothetical protein